MKMLMIIFRESIVEHIHAQLKEYDINAYSGLNRIAGKGETRPAVQSSLSPGANRMSLTAVSEVTAGRLIQGLTRFREELGLHRHGNTFPLHVFSLPCEQVV